MYISSIGISNGIIEKKYGSHGVQFNENDVPTYSIPFKIENAPDKTVSFAFILEDKDAYPVTGFIWVHWLGANLTRSELKKGGNSWTSILGNQQTREQTSCYGGMAPPDKAHIYELHVFALDKLLDLKNGFYLNELYQEMEGHILEEAVLKGLYEK